jgi:hypothetical protein
MSQTRSVLVAVVLSGVAVGCASEPAGPTGSCLDVLAYCSAGAPEECAIARASSAKGNRGECSMTTQELNAARREVIRLRTTRAFGHLPGIIDGYEKVGQLRYRLAQLKRGGTDVETAEALQTQLDESYAIADAALKGLQDGYYECPPPLLFNQPLP